SRDPTVTEVPDEEIAAEAPERGRRHCEAPGRVQLPAGRHAPEERPARVELVHEAEPGPATSSSRSASCFAYVTKMSPPTFWIPNGAKPGGILGSTNAPGISTWPKLPSKTSTCPLWKSVAYRRSPAIASPLKMASSPERSTATCAVVPSAAFHPRIFPSFGREQEQRGSTPDDEARSRVRD